MTTTTIPAAIAPDHGASSPAISVVMPVHNGERFLQEAIDSILGQTEASLELIAVDDGSTDRTAAILAQAESTDRRVRVQRLTARQGVTGALNEGCRSARGTFIARMDADDVSLPSRLAVQLAYLRAHPEVAVVGSWVRRIDERGVAGTVQRYPAEPGMVAWSMAFFNSLAHPTVLMRREALNMDAVYSADYPHAEDYALFAGLSRSTQLANIPEVLLHYRVWPGNVSRNLEQDRQAARVVRDHAAALGVPATEAETHGLQGLARDRYPGSPNELRALARVMVGLRSAVVERLPAGASRSPIDSDAAVRLWLLAALAARRSPLLAASLARRAFWISPKSLLTFLNKVAARVGPGR